ncbi:hypothetical protein CDD80_6134 [Ophiocordyceps camponoti-rufipedis]|uniref:WAP domain-containing protein n=1 Tax=Ophiocordyceps camponoti-rufipedis TaxID=2004952 RepID=A0A2C5ZHF0_9HYPO|nr:hypothetical protein CDD80_6134 [Ophiocordyceps camponoti-rufipedis]
MLTSTALTLTLAPISLITAQPLRSPPTSMQTPASVTTHGIDAHSAETEEIPVDLVCKRSEAFSCPTGYTCIPDAYCSYCEGRCIDRE